MIYTIGYQGLTSARLAEVMKRLSVDVLIDVRSVPHSRIPAFRQQALHEMLGQRYEWRPSLGGHTPITIGALQALKVDPRTVLIMCMEAAPGECHRHHAIAKVIGTYETPVLHIFDTQIIRHDQLQAAIDGGPEGLYEVEGHWDGSDEEESDDPNATQPELPAIK